MIKNFPLALYETAASWRNLLDNRLKPLGLSQAKWRAIFCLSRADSPLTQTQLAKQLGLEAPTVVGLIDRLAKEEWVFRQEDKQDRRSKVIHLTEKAKLTFDQMKNTANELSAEILAPLTEKELKACVSMLQKIKKQIEESYET